MLHIKTTLTLLTLALLTFNNCGKRKPPLPPVERIKQNITISGIQQGDTIILNGKLPLRNASNNNVQNISRIDIYRLVEKIDTPISLTEDEFASKSTLIDSVAVEQNSLLNKDFIYRDKLVFADQLVRIRYAIRYVNSNGQKAAFSNFLLIEPANTIAANPENLSLQTTQDAVIVNWNKPLLNVDGSSPVNVLGYNVYRIESNNDVKKLNIVLVKDLIFEDKKFAFESDYKYFVRAVSIGRNGEPIESLNSNLAQLTPKDTFPPIAPTAITIASSPGTISIFFAFNPEPDIAGYMIYRTTELNLPKEKWLLLTNKLLAVNTFQDNKIESGKIYYYYLIAVDKYGNASLPSDVVSETAS